MKPAHAAHPNLRRRGFIISTIIYLLVMVMFAGLLVSFGYKWYSSKNTQPTTSPPPEVQEQKADTKDPTANWKTYNAKNMNVSFKIPETWAVEEKLGSNDPDGPGVINAQVIAKNSTSNSSFSVKRNFFGGMAGITILNPLSQNISINGRKTLKEYHKRSCNDVFRCDQQAQKFFNDDIPIGWNITVENVNGNSYLISATWEESNYKEANILMNQILSTFRFLD